MATGPTTYFKLGLLTLFAALASMAAVFALGFRARQTATVRYHSYFDESVQGLNIGAPVTYRGVLIGYLADIEIAPDRKHVDVTLALRTRDAYRLGLDRATPDVRAQLGTQGITGIKFVGIDFFDPKTSPPPQLEFSPAINYIPAKTSLFKGLEDNVELIAQRMPSMIDDTTATLHRLASMLDDLRDQQIPGRIAKILDDVDRTVAELRGVVRHVDRAHLPDKTATALDRLTATLGDASAVLTKVGGDRGLVASAQRATDAIGDLGRNTVGSTATLEQTLRDLDEAAQAIRELVEAIDRDPDMLVKGRARTNKP
jgi:ABC-type transporter Mla subunit MlaD